MDLCLCVSKRIKKLDDSKVLKKSLKMGIITAKSSEKPHAIAATWSLYFSMGLQSMVKLTKIPSDLQES